MKKNNPKQPISTRTQTFLVIAMLLIEIHHFKNKNRFSDIDIS